MDALIAVRRCQGGGPRHHEQGIRVLGSLLGGGRVGGNFFGPIPHAEPPGPFPHEHIRTEGLIQRLFNGRM